MRNSRVTALKIRRRVTIPEMQTASQESNNTGNAAASQESNNTGNAAASQESNNTGNATASCVTGE